MRTFSVVGVFVVAGASLGIGLVQCSSDGAKNDAGTDGALSDTGPGTDTGPGDSGAGIPCNDGGCAGPLRCCANLCVSQLQNCGACGTACSAGQYCTGVACKDAVLSNLCEPARGTVVLDGVGNDDDAGGIFGSALAGCDAGIALRFVVASDAGGALGPNGQPATGPGDTLVTAGGPYYQPSVAYMEASLTPVFVQVVNNGSQVQLVNRATQAKLVDVPVSALTATHDYFLFQMSVEPQTATLAFMGYGLYPPGTAAGAWFFKNTLVPARATYTDRWYVYEWTDSDVSGGPSAGDTFTKIGSGK
jgi:hypothetical protein